MKRILAVVVACSAMAVWGQSAGPANTKAMTEAEFQEAMKRLNEMPTLPTPPKRNLGPIDKWRFESCQTDAAKAPTSQGVFAGLRVCREKFGQ